jgi:RHS repeat-associated protein
LTNTYSHIEDFKKAYKYKFENREWQDELGLNMYDFGGRMYMPDIVRTPTVDPLAEQTPNWSPYAFCNNNPVRYTDPTGMSTEDPGDIYNLKGEHIGSDGRNDNAVYLLHTNSNKQLTQSQSEHLIQGSQAPGVFIGPQIEQKAIGNDELNLRSSLSTLKQTEAGRTNPPLDYNSWNHGDNFTTDTYADNPKAYSEHPGKNPNSGSTAGGAYQAMERFYTGTDFSPQNQDKTAVKNMTSFSYNAALSGDMSTFKTTTQARWTSLKEWSVPQLQTTFNSYRAKELTGNSTIATPVGQLLRR